MNLTHYDRLIITDSFMLRIKKQITRTYINILLLDMLVGMGPVFHINSYMLSVQMIWYTSR